MEPTNASAAQIARLAATLPQGGAPRLERLRGFGASVGDTLICLCSRIILADNSAGVLVVSTERTGEDLSLPDRAQRLLADLDPAAAIFTADGEMMLTEAGGLDSLFIETKSRAPAGVGNGGRLLTISSVNGSQKPVDGRLTPGTTRTRWC